MIEDVIKEKTSADHLLYVSLKYTKTCDVILNLIRRWKIMMEVSFNSLLEKAKKKKKISKVPTLPKKRIDALKKIFKKNEEIMKTIELYDFFRRIEDLERMREHEFRKNVTLRIIDKGKEIEINLDKLKEYQQLLEKFISEVKQFLVK